MQFLHLLTYYSANIFFRHKSLHSVLRTPVKMTFSLNLCTSVEMTVSSLLRPNLPAALRKVGEDGCCRKGFLPHPYLISPPLIGFKNFFGHIESFQNRHQINVLFNFFNLMFILLPQPPDSSYPKLLYSYNALNYCRF